MNELQTRLIVVCVLTLVVVMLVSKYEIVKPSTSSKNKLVLKASLFIAISFGAFAALWNKF
ncbi:hypothetical protein MI467_06250 [Delftia acidovorans]|uniref:hypothetical protein n=1 Tax=Delftia acidovorans TaxID=80866 RepID=UPI001EFD7C7A|nr:hypothetical protein [Delftia acidovorans]MCG8986441.1 hypothetical protein [Delftia acidovorans]